MISDPTFYLLAVPAVLIVGISKGGFGGGLGLLAVPMMALEIGPAQAAAIMLPILCAMDLFGIHAYRGCYDARNLKILLPASLLGIVLGTLGFQHLSPAAIRLVLGAIAIAFTAHYALGAYLGDAPPRPGSVASGAFWGTVSGFTTFVAHAGGPPLSVYLLPQRMDKTLFVGTTVLFYAFVNYAKIAPYAWLGLLSAQNLKTSLALLPLAPLGIWLGVWLHRRVPAASFYRLCYVFLFAVGVKLLLDGLRGLG